MKKYINALLFFVICFSGLQAMSPLGRITGRLITARAATAALRPTNFQCPSRPLTDIAHTYKLSNLGVHSPLIGLLATLPVQTLQGSQPPFLNTILNTTDPTLPAKELCNFFFHQNPLDQQITITQYNKQMMRALPPCGLAYLLKIAYKTVDSSDSAQQESMIAEWNKRYTQLSTSIHDPIVDPRNFKKKARKLLQEFEKVAHTLELSQVSSIVLAALVKMSYDKNDLQEFARCFSCDLDEGKYSDQDFLLLDTMFQQAVIPEEQYSPQLFEKMLYWIARKQQLAFSDYDAAILKASKLPQGYLGLPSRALCTEESLRTFINVLLYNPKTKTLDLSLVPETARNNTLFCNFIEQHKNVHAVNYYTAKNARQWLSLLAEIPEVNYTSGMFEITSEPQNALKALKVLFGLPSVNSYAQLAKELCTAERTILLQEDTSTQKVTLSIQRTQGKELSETPVEVELNVYFKKHHSYAEFQIDTIFSAQGLKNLTRMFFLLIKSHAPECNSYKFVDFTTISLENFMFLIKQEDTFNSTDFVQKVLASDRIELFKPLCEAGFKPSDEIIKTFIHNKKYLFFSTALTHRFSETINPHFLYKALALHDIELLKILLEHKVVVDGSVKTILGHTPLHVALHTQCPLEIIKLLIESGADPAQKDSEGRTALEFSIVRKNSADIQRYLKKLASQKKN